MKPDICSENHMVNDKKKKISLLSQNRTCTISVTKMSVLIYYNPYSLKITQGRCDYKHLLQTPSKNNTRSITTNACIQKP